MEFMNQFERRNQDRFKIPGAKVVFYTLDGQLNDLPLIDMSKSSIRFRYTGNLSKENVLSFDLIIPSKEKISLKGNIVEISIDNAEQINFVIVQFAPFSTVEHYNSHYSHGQLSKLFQDFAII